MPTSRRTMLTGLLGTLLYTTSGWAQELRGSDRHPSVWYCPSVFTPNHAIRNDYVQTLLDENTWSGLNHAVTRLKFYIESLIPGNGHLSAREIDLLVKLCSRHSLKACFEVGALRTSASNFGFGSGQRYAEQECLVLDRWTQAGGTIDFVTADNPVMQTVGLIYKRNSVGLLNSYQPSLSDIIDEAARAMAVFRSRYPAAVLGSTESLGFFDVKTALGIMQNLDPTHLPTIRFDEFLAEWLSALSKVDVRLDHFHIDFGIEAVRSDGHGYRLNFERVAEVVNLLRFRGIRSGLMVSAFDDFSLAHTSAPNAATATRSAIKNTYDYLDEFLRAQIKVEDILLDRWEPYPDRTGPISDETTDLGLAFGLIKHLTLSGYM